MRNILARWNRVSSVSIRERFLGDDKDKQEDDNYEFKRTDRDSNVIDVDQKNNQPKKRKLKKIWFFYFDFEHIY